MTPDTITGFELPGRAEIEELARRVHEALGTHFPEGAAQECQDLAALSRMLLGPVLDRIAGKRLAIAADGALWYVPFAALPVPGRVSPGGEVPLIIEHEVIQVPSTTVLRKLRRSREGRPRPAGAVAPVFEPTDIRLQTARASRFFFAQGAPLARDSAPAFPYDGEPRCGNTPDEPKSAAFPFSWLAGDEARPSKERRQ